MGSRKKPHIALFPSFGTGHLIPFLEFAKRMAVDHGFTVTFITTPSLHSSAETTLMQGLVSSGSDISLLEFPPLPQAEEEAAPPQSAETFLIGRFQTIENCKGPVKDVLGILKGDVCAFVTDLFCTAMVEVSASLHIPVNIDDPVDIPGLPAMPVRYFPEPMQTRADTICHLFLRHSHRLCNADGILINTFHDLESGALRALLHRKRELLPEGVETGPEIYPIGPLIRSPEVEPGKSGCLEWLDRQPASVIFVAFGSGGFLAAEQARELALGLEDSGLRFLWVVRTPPGLSLSGFLPPGFETRTNSRGLVWSSWAPQTAVLSHPSTGGFVSHCGWNSVLESVSCGVPLIAWPLVADQKTSAFCLVNEIGVALEPAWRPNWWVGKEEVARVTREMIDGEGGRKVRRKALQLKQAAAKAVAVGGTSTELLSALAAQWKNGN
ncbi:hypothetical protein KI387_038758 [Taxus chinensis]|uniref:Glycosyltransferase n=1 Tax=Taxus chinensis TaxID=29808 RepID=A0AA38C780_TAXCH|nr:hypothetical protein KI387_038758 [Taxus chinensis]